MKKLQVVCAYCRVVINKGPKNVRGVVSHGICDPCFKVETEKLEQLKREGAQ
jgi:hypothetical protein